VKVVYDPTHPDADEKGFVSLPDINIVMEMAQMINVSKTYEACATAFDATEKHGPEITGYRQVTQAR